jgi:hypothetical protein
MEMEDIDWSILVFLGLFVAVFTCFLLRSVMENAGMFVKRHGRMHRICGAAYLCLLAVGFLDLYFTLFDWNSYGLAYHASLGLLGTVLTLTAAFEFQHKHVKNVASGTLDEHATVTFDEMIEHSFYQGLNLFQIIYLHVLGGELGLAKRLFYLIMLATLPWSMRGYFPVNKFSDNYCKFDEKSTNLIRLLYRIKKYQYIFYKHFLLHGLNISVAFFAQRSTTKLTSFRLYWLLLNTSYTMEFFLQTLVKKKYLAQNSMLLMQKLLMGASSVAALHVLRQVSFIAASFSLLLNFLHRKRDLWNTVLVACTMVACDSSKRDELLSTIYSILR